MSLFRPAVQDNQHVKMLAYGGPGAGKTLTLSRLAIGAAKASGVPGPIYFIDTEKGLGFVLHEFKAAGIEVRKATHEDLKGGPIKGSRFGKEAVVASGTMRNFARACGVAASEGASALIVDSLSWFWAALEEEFAPSALADWQAPKAAWQACIRYLMVDAPFHVLVCTRSANLYEDVVGKTGKATKEKTGTKAKVDADTSYEPSLVVRMESGLERGAHVVRAIIEKDRTDAFPMGSIIKNPTFEALAPIWDRMALGAPGPDDSRNRASGPEAEAPAVPSEPAGPEPKPGMFEALELREGWSWPAEAAAYERPWGDAEDEEPVNAEFLEKCAANDREKKRGLDDRATLYQVAFRALEAGWSLQEIRQYVWKVEGWNKIALARADDLLAWLSKAAEARAKAFEEDAP